MATQAATAAQTEGPSLADRRGTMLADQRGTMLVVDVGSTFTKAALVDLTVGRVSARGETPTTLDTDARGGGPPPAAGRADPPPADAARTLACSSAGGGLRLAVVGYERTVTAEAGYRVGLSAGAKVVHVASGALGPDELAALAHARPDIVLLVGGTDGGNAEGLQHNGVALGWGGFRCAGARRLDRGQCGVERGDEQLPQAF